VVIVVVVVVVVVVVDVFSEDAVGLSDDVLELVDEYSRVGCLASQLCLLEGV
jgi:hypothetical protein